VACKSSAKFRELFSPRALNWVKEYVTRRHDQGEALFVVGRRGRPMKLCAALTRFRRFRRMVRFPKPVTAHMLRHTVATTLLFNGCPIGHIKDILGHDRLITTCNFYFGADKRAAKKAHGDFLDYELMNGESDRLAAISVLAAFAGGPLLFHETPRGRVQGGELETERRTMVTEL
jgi:hypothetical protein